MNEHSVTVLRDRHGEIVGASVFLSPAEVQELQESGSVEIAAEDGGERPLIARPAPGVFPAALTVSICVFGGRVSLPVLVGAGLT